MIIFTKDNIGSSRGHDRYMGRLKDYKKDDIIKYGLVPGIGNYTWHVIGTDISFYFSAYLRGRNYIYVQDEHGLLEVKCFGAAIKHRNVSEEISIPFFKCTKRIRNILKYMFTKENVITTKYLGYIGCLNTYYNDDIIKYGRATDYTNNHAWYVIGTNIHFYFYLSEPYIYVTKITQKDYYYDEPQSCFGAAIENSGLTIENFTPLLEVLDEYGLL